MLCARGWGLVIGDVSSPQRDKQRKKVSSWLYVNSTVAVAWPGTHEMPPNRGQKLEHSEKTFIRTRTPTRH